MLILAIGFLTFSVIFYLNRQADVRVEAPQPSTQTPSRPQPSTQTPPVSYSEGWQKVFGEARVAMDADICQRLATTEEVRDCADKIHLLIAYRDQDINKCRSIFSPDLRDTCYINLGTNLNVDFCKFLSNEEARQECALSQEE